MATGSSAYVAGLLKARNWSLRLLLMAAVSVLAGVVWRIWFAVSLTRTFAAQWGQPDLSHSAVPFLLRVGIGPFLLPLVMILLCGCLVLIHRPPQSHTGTVLWSTPTSRFAQLQAELVALAMLTGLVALGYAGTTLVGLTNLPEQIPIEEVWGLCATILASSVATLCLLGVWLTYWWILGVPRTQEVVTHEVVTQF